MPEADCERLVDSLRRLTEADPRIIALLVYGSRAGGSADRLSDLDVGIVTTDDAYEEVVAGTRDLVGSLGRPLLREDFGNPRTLHVILAEGIDLELIMDRESDLELYEPFRVVFDRFGVVERALARSASVQAPRLDAAEVQRQLEGFWHDVGHLVTALGRGNTWWAYGQLDELRRMCLNLARLEVGMAPEDEAYWKVDEALPPQRLASLRATVALPEIGPMLAAASAILDLYRELAMALAARHRVPYPTELDRLLSDRLRGVKESR